MSILIQYLVKLSISLGIVWLFYQFILRRLTFYNSNRWYLLGYTLLSFFIPFINISLILQNGDASANNLVQFIPSVHKYTIALEEASHCPVPIWSTQYDKWDWIAFALMSGAAILLLRFFIRYISFIRIRNKSELISVDGIKIYQVNEDIIPFSFGHSVFINRNQHSEEELKEIVRHEFVHVRQHHTIDIVWAELLCILNWYNPFAWLLKRSIRQNLEFIADNKVIENGINKKEYQYLLLKVIGNNQYSIATQFNFSSLKKRIAMMNKLKSTKRQLLRMLFLLPATAVLLLAFRNEIKFHNKSNSFLFTGLIMDANTNSPLKNVAVIEKNSGLQTKSDVKGFFKMEVPVNKKELELNVKFEKNGFDNVSFRLRTENPSGSNIEFVYLKNLSNPIEGSSTHSQHFDGLADYNQVVAAFNEYIAKVSELEVIDAISKKTADPILIYNGVPYAIGNGVKAWLDEADLQESSEFRILVDGKIMTMEEVNRTISRIDIDGAGTLSKKDALKKYNINYNLITLVVHKTGQQLNSSDTIPHVTITNSKGYYIDIKDDNGNCTVVVKDKNKKEVKRLLLTEWNAKDDYYENLYGEILSPTTAIVEEKIKANNPAITAVTVKGNTATVTLKNGKTEVYTLSLKDQKKAFEERCGIKEIAIAPTETLTEVRVTTAQTAPVPIEERISTTVAEPVEVSVATIADDFEINDEKAVMHLRNGKTEEYNLKNPKEKAAFEKKFGKVIKPSVSTTTGVYSIISPVQESSPSIATTVSIVPTKEVAVIGEATEIFTTDDAKAITIEPDVLLTITKNTTKEQLESFKAALKAKGFELSFDEIEFKNGILVKISGTIKSKDGQANFVGVDFNKIIVSQVTKGEKTYFRIDEVVKKKGIS